MPDAVDIARALLTKAAELGVALSDHDLHQLAVHAQSWFMAGHRQPLFEEPVIAGEDGPVIPEIRDALRAGGIACFADIEDAYDHIGHYAVWQANAVVRDHVSPCPPGPAVDAEIAALIKATPTGCDVDRDALRRCTREAIDKHRKPPLDVEAAIRRLDDDPEFLEYLLERAEAPFEQSFRPR